MKSVKRLTLIMCILSTLSATAQVPQQINYQAVARNAAGIVLANQPVSVRFTIHDATATGTIDYQETQTGLSTNQFGLFTTAIGTGTQVGTNTFASINWGASSKYLQVEIDPAGGTNYVDMGTTQLNAVPYALNCASSAQWYTSGNDIYNLNTNTTHISGTPSGTTLRIDNSGAQDVVQFHNHSNTYAGYVGIKNDTTGMDIGTANGNATGTFNLVTDGTTRVTITHAGLTGIGTTTPLAKLDIHSSSGTNALHISGLTAGTDTTEQILTINRLTGMIDTTHLLHYIGESYGGGIVFYVYDNGLHGLIAAASDQSTGIQWYNGTNRVTGAIRVNISGGKSNTDVIVAAQIADNQNGNFAALVCANYQPTTSSGYTFNDWYLPSINELYLMNINIGLGATGPNHNIGNFGTNTYWSSTEANYNLASILQFGTNAMPLNGLKSTSYYVRAVRAF